MKRWSSGEARHPCENHLSTGHAMDSWCPKNLNKILPVDHPGDQHTSARLLTLLYSDLQRLAQGMMAHYPTENLNQATALVHEAYLRLGPPEDRVWNGRGHYFGATAQAMRRINLDCDTLCDPKFTIDFIDLECPPRKIGDHPITKRTYRLIGAEEDATAGSEQPSSN